MRGCLRWRVLKRNVASHLGPFVLLPALWLHGKRTAYPAAVHWDRRRPPPETPCLLPGPPHHGQNCLYRQSWSHAIKHQNPGDPPAARKQHESHVSVSHPRNYTHLDEYPPVTASQVICWNLECLQLKTGRKGRTSNLTSFYLHSKCTQFELLTLSITEASLLTDQVIKMITTINHRERVMSTLIHYWWAKY